MDFEFDLTLSHGQNSKRLLEYFKKELKAEYLTNLTDGQLQTMFDFGRDKLGLLYGTIRCELNHREALAFNPHFYD